MELLIDGKEAFVEIINCINNAKSKIFINMFIWRDDVIGNKVAESLLHAANKGVSIELSIDRYGCILEHAEEYKLSFFHRKLKLLEKIQVKLLQLSDKKLAVKGKTKSKSVKLYNDIISHPKIKIDANRNKKDHSKYYIFDDEVLIFGGINIEDKENGSDISGRVYQDYMIKLIGKQYVWALYNKLDNNINCLDDCYFGINYKENGKKIFEMKKLYLNMINDTKKDLLIIMPYFLKINSFKKAILNAYNRSVKITILIPKSSNFDKDTNFCFVKHLLKKSNNMIDVYLSPKMVHTKMIIADDLITMGSTNIANKSFNVLSELNLFIKKDMCSFFERLEDSIDENIKISKKVNNYKSIKYNKFKAFFESLIV